MKKFLVLYMSPASGLEQWLKMDESFRKEEEAKMQAAWEAWMSEHGKMFSGPTAGAGKTKRVSRDGIVDVKNDVMLFSIVEAATQDEVAEAFKSHPHFGIPDAWVDIMPVNFLPGMEG